MPFQPRLIALYFLSVIFSMGHAQELIKSQIPLFCAYSKDLQERLSDLDAVLNNPVFITHVSFDCDITCSEQELLYLLGIRDNQFINAYDLKKGLLYLSQKNKFESFLVYIFEEGGVNNLHVVLKSWWTFTKARCKGILLGKDNVLREYMLQPGDRFDTAKHQLSVENIKTVFKNQGYFDIHIDSEFVRDAATKTVESVLHIDKRIKYTVSSSVLTLDGHITQSEKNQLQNKLHLLFFKPLHGAAYDKASINKQCCDLKEYLEKKGYPHISIDLEERIKHDTKTVEISFLIDLFQKKEFVFLGNNFFTKQQLLKEILMFGRSAWLLPTHMLAQELVSKYQKKGFCAAVIDSKEESDRSFFLITEGQRFAIKEVIIEGVTLCDPQLLVKKYCTPILKARYFDEYIAKRCIDDLVSHYVSQGFWEVKTSDYTIVPLAEKGCARLALKIIQGPQLMLNTVAIEPFKHLEGKGPCSFVAGSPVPFNFYHLKEQRAWITAQLEKEGFVAIQAEPEIIRSGNTVDLIWHVKVSAKNNIFGKVVIQGASSLPYEYIMRELSLPQGDVLDAKKLRTAHQKLKQLELFDALVVSQGQSIFSTPEQPILIKAIKDDPFEVRLRGGMGLLQLNKQYTFAGLTYKAGGSLLWKNPFNYADHMRFDADFSWSERSVVAQYCRPWLWNIPARTVVELYDMHYKQPGILQNQKSLYELTQQGFLVSLNRRWPFVETAANFGVEWMETTVSEKLCGYDVNPAVARALNFEPSLVDRKIPFVYAEPTVFVDYLDNKVQPTRGSLSVATVKGMFPLKSIGIQTYFIKVQFEQSLYIPVMPCVLAVRFRVGHIFHHHLSSIMPSERFYLGGANSIRSYQTDMAPPLGELMDLNSKRRFVPQGGKSMFNVNTEIRFPVYNMLGGVVFQDLGALSSNKLADITPKDVVAGTGFGLRYNTPIGPLRFDIAWKWNRGDKDIASYAWFITFGNAF